MEHVELRIGSTSVEGHDRTSAITENTFCANTPNSNQPETFEVSCPMPLWGRYITGQKTVEEIFSFDEIFLYFSRGELIS